MPPDIDERAIELIAEQVAAMLEAKLEAIAARVINGSEQRELTVEQVAERFGLARSTVYAHWREWGGCKLGTGEKAPIRFEERALRGLTQRIPTVAEQGKNKGRRRRDLLNDNPKHEQLLGPTG